MRSGDGDEIAVVWEWEGVWKANEMKKLKEHRIWSADKRKEALKYAVFSTYTHTPNIQRVCDHVADKWKCAR